MRLANSSLEISSFRVPNHHWIPSGASTPPLQLIHRLHYLFRPGGDCLRVGGVIVRHVKIQHRRHRGPLVASLSQHDALIADLHLGVQDSAVRHLDPFHGLGIEGLENKFQ